MGDNRLSVKIKVIGKEGKPEVIDWWVNWHPSRPAEIYAAIVDMADKAGLNVDCSEIYGGSAIWQDRHIDYLEERLERANALLKALEGEG